MTKENKISLIDLALNLIRKEEYDIGLFGNVDPSKLIYCSIYLTLNNKDVLNFDITEYEIETKYGLFNLRTKIDYGFNIRVEFYKQTTKNIKYSFYGDSIEFNIDSEIQDLLIFLREYQIKKKELEKNKLSSDIKNFIDNYRIK